MPSAELCFYCYEDDIKELAVARYEARDGETYYVCKNHLELVKQSGLDYEMLEVK